MSFAHPRPAGHATVGPCPDNSYGCSSVIDPRDPRAEVLPIVNFANCTGTCWVPITGFMSVYILGVGRWGSYVQDIGMVIRNSVGSVTALNNAAMGDVMLVQSKKSMSKTFWVIVMTYGTSIRQGPMVGHHPSHQFVFARTISEHGPRYYI
jgi:hypothetical protein